MMSFTTGAVLLLLVFAVYFAFFVFDRVYEGERAVRLTLGKREKNYLKPGPCLVWWPFQTLDRLMYGSIEVNPGRKAYQAKGGDGTWYVDLLLRVSQADIGRLLYDVKNPYAFLKKAVRGIIDQEMLRYTSDDLLDDVKVQEFFEAVKAKAEVIAKNLGFRIDEFIVESLEPDRITKKANEGVFQARLAADAARVRAQGEADAFAIRQRALGPDLMGITRLDVARRAAEQGGNTFFMDLGDPDFPGAASLRPRSSRRARWEMVQAGILDRVAKSLEDKGGQQKKGDT